MKLSQVPNKFDETFLAWFKDRTETYWSKHEPVKFADYQQQIGGIISGVDWQKGTRWLDGLSPEQITQIENNWSIQFPPDYKLFLQHLHSVDKPRIGALFTGKGGALETVERPSFYNWITGSKAIQDRYDTLRELIEFDIENNDVWFDEWGEKPNSLPEQKKHIQELIKTAPKLIPIFEHRFLLPEPNKAGNPVISIYQTDAIIYGIDLRTYFLHEFADLLDVSRDEIVKLINQERQKLYLDIPFWGELIS